MTDSTNERAVPDEGAASPRPDEFIRQIVVVHESVWEALNEWATQRGLSLAQMPTVVSDIPTYCFSIGAQR